MHNHIVQILTKLILFVIDIGFVWLIAWISKPDIDSGFVWLLAFMYAGILNMMYKTKEI